MYSECQQRGRWLHNALRVMDKLTFKQINILLSLEAINYDQIACTVAKKFLYTLGQNTAI
jgi:hypothetical protein